MEGKPSGVIHVLRLDTGKRNRQMIPWNHLPISLSRFLGGCPPADRGLVLRTAPTYPKTATTRYRNRVRGIHNRGFFLVAATVPAGMKSRSRPYSLQWRAVVAAVRCITYPQFPDYRRRHHQRKYDRWRHHRRKRHRRIRDQRLQHRRRLQDDHQTGPYHQHSG